MTALGINISTKDQTYGWADIKPTKYKPAHIIEIEDRIIQNERYLDMLCDVLEDNGGNPSLYAEMDEISGELELMYKQRSGFYQYWHSTGDVHEPIPY